MLIRPFCAYRRTNTFLCLSGLFMLTSAHVPFYACQAFLCLSVDELLQFVLIIVEKKMKSTYLETTVFFKNGLSSSIFRSRQKDRWYLLDLSVTTSRPPPPSAHFQLFGGRQYIVKKTSRHQRLNRLTSINVDFVHPDDGDADLIRRVSAETRAKISWGLVTPC